MMTTATVLLLFLFFILRIMSFFVFLCLSFILVYLFLFFIFVMLFYMYIVWHRHRTLNEHYVFVFRVIKLGPNKITQPQPYLITKPRGHIFAEVRLKDVRCLECA
jgi:hypothetical protein